MVVVGAECVVQVFCKRTPPMALWAAKPDMNFQFCIQKKTESACLLQLQTWFLIAICDIHGSLTKTFYLMHFFLYVSPGETKTSVLITKSWREECQKHLLPLFLSLSHSLFLLLSVRVWKYPKWNPSQVICLKNSSSDRFRVERKS